MPDTQVPLDTDNMSDTQFAVDRILDLADPIFRLDSTDESVANAVIAIEKIVDDTVAERTEQLRGALAEMLGMHGRRFRIDGRCRCPACFRAEELLGGCN